MNRYSSIGIQTRWDGKRAYKSVEYPRILPQNTDIQIVANETTYLDSLANLYYKDSSLWWIIVLANSGLGNGRLSVKAGTTLRIPTNVNYIINQFKLLNR